MPFPINPQENDVYEVDNNLFIFSFNNGWKRIERDKIFKYHLPPTLADKQGGLWQNTSNNIIYIWRDNLSKWVPILPNCQKDNIVYPAYMKLYHSNYTDLVTKVLPKTINSLPYERPINGRIPSEYEVEINGPANYSTEGFITYFFQFFDKDDNVISLNNNSFSCIWDASNNTGSFKPTLYISSGAISAANKWGIPAADKVYYMIVQYDGIGSSNYFKILPQDSYLNPSSFNVLFSHNSINNLSIMNSIPAAHHPFRASPTGIFGYTNTRARSIPARLNAVIYPQNSQVQKVGEQFSIPIVIEAVTGYDNVYDNGDNFTGSIVNVPSDGQANMTYQNITGTISISAVSLENVYGTPTFSLGGTTTVTPTDGIAVFKDLVLNVSNYGLSPNQIGVANLSVTSTDTRFRSRPIKIYWTK